MSTRSGQSDEPASCAVDTLGDSSSRVAACKPEDGHEGGGKAASPTIHTTEIGDVPGATSVDKRNSEGEIVLTVNGVAELEQEPASHSEGTNQALPKKTSISMEVDNMVIDTHEQEAIKTNVTLAKEVDKMTLNEREIEKAKADTKHSAQGEFDQLEMDGITSVPTTDVEDNTASPNSAIEPNGSATRSLPAHLRPSLQDCPRASDGETSSGTRSTRDKYLEAQRITRCDPPPRYQSNAADIRDQLERTRAQLKHTLQTLEQERSQNRPMRQKVAQEIRKDMEKALMPLCESLLHQQVNLVKQKGKLAKWERELELEEHISGFLKEFLCIGQQQLFLARESVDGDVRTLEAAQVKLAYEQGAADAIHKFRKQEAELNARNEELQVRETDLATREAAYKAIIQEVVKAKMCDKVTQDLDANQSQTTTSKDGKYGNFADGSGECFQLVVALQKLDKILGTSHELFFLTDLEHPRNPYNVGMKVGKVALKKSSTTTDKDGNDGNFVDGYNECSQVVIALQKLGKILGTSHELYFLADFKHPHNPYNVGMKVGQLIALKSEAEQNGSTLQNGHRPVNRNGVHGSARATVTATDNPFTANSRFSQHASATRSGIVYNHNGTASPGNDGMYTMAQGSGGHGYPNHPLQYGDTEMSGNADPNHGENVVNGNAHGVGGFRGNRSIHGSSNGRGYLNGRSGYASRSFQANNRNDFEVTRHAVFYTPSEYSRAGMPDFQTVNVGDRVIRQGQLDARANAFNPDEIDLDEDLAELEAQADVKVDDLIDFNDDLF